MMKKSKLVIFLVLGILLSSTSIAAESTDPCQDIAPWQIWDWTICKIKAIPNSIGEKIKKAFEGFFDAIIAPGDFAKPNHRLYNISQFIAFAGISLLIIEIGIRLFQSGFNPTAKDIASRQARGIVLMVVLVLVGPVLISFMLDAVKVVADAFIQVSGTQYSSIILQVIGSIGSILTTTAIVFVVAWPTILAMFLYFLAAIIIRTFLLYTLITIFPLILFLFFWERTRKVGVIFLNLLLLNIFIPLLWVILFVMAFSVPESSVTAVFLKPVIMFLTFPLSAYLYFKMVPISPAAFIPSAGFLKAGGYIAGVARESTLKASVVRYVGLEKSIPKEDIAVERAKIIHGREWKSMSPVEKHEAVQKQYAPLISKWSEHVHTTPEPSQEVVGKGMSKTIYPIKANELIMFKDTRHWTPQDKRLNQIYMRGESDDFFNYISKENKIARRALQLSEKLNEEGLSRDDQLRIKIGAKEMWNKIFPREQDRLFDNFEKSKKMKVTSKV